MLLPPRPALPYGDPRPHLMYPEKLRQLAHGPWQRSACMHGHVRSLLLCTTGRCRPTGLALQPSALTGLWGRMVTRTVQLLSVQLSLLTLCSYGLCSRSESSWGVHRGLTLACAAVLGLLPDS